jgi:hypothetical protein
VTLFTLRSGKQRLGAREGNTMRKQLLLLAAFAFLLVAVPVASAQGGGNSNGTVVINETSVTSGSVTFVVTRTSVSNANLYVENICYADVIGGTVVLDNKLSVTWDHDLLNRIGSVGPTPTAGVICEADVIVSNKSVANSVYIPVA